MESHAGRRAVGRRAAARPPLSRDLVLHAAMRLADVTGIESVTMRRLAQELGVEAMSLYHYVSNKDDLLHGIVDVVVGEIGLPADGSDWKGSLRQSAISAHDVLRRHPWACQLLMSGSTIRPARLRYMDSVLRCLREAGFSTELTHHAYHALDSHITGFTLWEASLSVAEDDLPELAAAFLQEFPVEEYPYFAEHVQHHATDSSAEGSEFEFGLDLILDGLERLRVRRGGRRTPA